MNNYAQQWKPEKECEDPNCPYHGEISVRGRAFTGTVIADRMSKTVSVEWDRRKYWPKYDRYAKRRSRVKAHNPPCINAKEGQKVRIAETRRISKTKNFVVLRVLDNDAPVKAAKVEKTVKKETKKESKQESKSSKEVPARSTVESMTKDDIKAYAKKEFGVELSTNDTKKVMIDNLFKEMGGN